MPTFIPPTELCANATDVLNVCKYCCYIFRIVSKQKGTEAKIKQTATIEPVQHLQSSDFTLLYAPAATKMAARREGAQFVNHHRLKLKLNA